RREARIGQESRVDSRGGGEYCSPRLWGVECGPGDPGRKITSPRDPEYGPIGTEAEGRALTPLNRHLSTSPPSTPGACRRACLGCLQDGTDWIAWLIA